MIKNNLLCVNHGAFYTPKYVYNLWKSAMDYTQEGFNFYLFTDNSSIYPQNLGWNFIQLPDWETNINGFKPWWYKIEIFNQAHGIAGNNLYLDLDVVIINNIDSFWNYSPEEFRICHDFNRAFSKKIMFSNSSIMGWRDNAMHHLYKKFIENMQYTVHKFRGDQDYIHDNMIDREVFWPREWAMSWKWEIYRGGKMSPHSNLYKSDQTIVIPNDTKIIVCHGKPNPHEITELSSYWNK